MSLIMNIKSFKMNNMVNKWDFFSGCAPLNDVLDNDYVVDL